MLDTPLRDLDLILDVEATCWDSPPPWRERPAEIIEIGVVAGPSVNDLSAGNAFMVKPVIHSILTEFCTKLTTITQDQVDLARGFKDVFGDFLGWAMVHTGKTIDQIHWGSWGFFDLNILQENCKIHKLPLFLNPVNHHNVKLMCLPLCGLKKGGIDTAAAKLGIPWEGTHHRGIDDAKMIDKVYQRCRGISNGI